MFKKAETYTKDELEDFLEKVQNKYIVKKDKEYEEMIEEVRSRGKDMGAMEKMALVAKDMITIKEFSNMIISEWNGD